MSKNVSNKMMCKNVNNNKMMCKNVNKNNNMMKKKTMMMRMLVFQEKDFRFCKRFFGKGRSCRRKSYCFSWMKCRNKCIQLSWARRKGKKLLYLYNTPIIDVHSECVMEKELYLMKKEDSSLYVSNIMNG